MIMTIYGFIWTNNDEGNNNDIISGIVLPVEELVPNEIVKNFKRTNRCTYWVVKRGHHKQLNYVRQYVNHKLWKLLQLRQRDSRILNNIS